MSRRALLVSLISLLPVALLAACGGKALGSETTGKGAFKSIYDSHVVDVDPAKRGRQPVFSGKSFEGETITQAGLRGSVAVVNFWASWCAPCRNEEANLQALWQRYEPRGVVFLGINTRDTKAEARTFIEEFGVTYPSIFDPYAKIAFRFHVGPLPVTYVLDRQGRIASTIVGPVADGKVLEQILERELKS